MRSATERVSSRALAPRRNSAVPTWLLVDFEIESHYQQAGWQGAVRVWSACTVHIAVIHLARPSRGTASVHGRLARRGSRDSGQAVARSSSAPSPPALRSGAHRRSRSRSLPLSASSARRSSRLGSRSPRSPNTQNPSSRRGVPRASSCGSTWTRTGTSLKRSFTSRQARRSMRRRAPRPRGFAFSRRGEGTVPSPRASSTASTSGSPNRHRPPAPRLRLSWTSRPHREEALLAPWRPRRQHPPRARQPSPRQRSRRR